MRPDSRREAGIINGRIVLLLSCHRWRVSTKRMTSDWIYICTLCEKMSESVSPNKIPLITIIKLVSESDPSSKKILLNFKKDFLLAKVLLPHGC